MGYDIFITRKEELPEEDEHKIELEEWLAYVERDPDMRHEGYAEIEIESPDGETLRREGDGTSVWTGHPDYESDGIMACFRHSGDQIQIKSPDDAMLRKVFQIARSLDARVRGEEGEFYEEDELLGWQETENQIGREVRGGPTPEGAKPRKPWWKFW